MFPTLPSLSGYSLLNRVPEKPGKNKLNFIFLFFFKDFIYLSEREREQEQGKKQREKRTPY